MSCNDVIGRKVDLIIDRRPVRCPEAPIGLQGPKCAAHSQQFFLVERWAKSIRLARASAYTSRTQGRAGRVTRLNYRGDFVWIS